MLILLIFIYQNFFMQARRLHDHNAISKYRIKLEVSQQDDVEWSTKERRKESIS